VTLLITACSKNKSVKTGLSAADLGRGTVATISRQWFDRLLSYEDRFAASAFYAGRGHGYAATAAQQHNTQHLIMSAGLGLVGSNDLIPPYQLTVKSGEADSILPHLVSPATATDWWDSVTLNSPWTRRLREEWDGSTLLVVALPLDYLQMLAPALESLPLSAMAKVRVISGAKAGALPEALRAHRLPYDARFNGPDSPTRGIDSDFLGRAAAHFLGFLEGSGGGSIHAHRQLVESVLSAMRPSSRRQGRSVPDEAISEIIRSHLGEAERGSNELLRLLRHDLGIACEQGRFRRLYADAIAEPIAA